MSTMDLSVQKLEKALSLRKRIHQLEAELSSLFGQAKGSRSGPGKQRVSAATRAKLAAAARANWAKRKGSGGGPATAKKKGGLTPAGRRKLSQLMRARWAAKRKAAGKAK